MARLKTWPTLTLVLLMMSAVFVFSALFVPVAAGEISVSDISNNYVGQQTGLLLATRPWRVATDNRPHRSVRSARRRAYRGRVPSAGYHVPAGYYVPAGYPASAYRSHWRLSSGYAVRYKCPMKSYWLPLAVKENSFNCDNAFEDKK